ncbi:MAG: response regulator [Polyangiaceae bacterium]
MSLGSEELYDLFLALAPARLEAARQALSVEAGDRESRLHAALVPFAVDAALLGVDGLRELALATAAAGQDAPEGDLERALEVLETAAETLAHGDESGARVNESELKARAKSLRSHLPRSSPSEPEASSEDDGDDSVWRPTLEADMIGAFLDECNERLEGLSERLLELESRGNDRELVSELFRDLHTLKGSSAFAGLKKMNRVAHLAEDLIGELRDGKREITRGLIDVLLETLDVLKAIVDKARARAAIDVEVGTLLQRLKDPEVVPFSAPKASDSAPGGAAANLAPKPQASRASSQGSATLRIDFEKVDRLLNLVGEVVLARGRLTAAADSQATLARELSSLRQKLSRIKNLPETLEQRGSGKGNVADELQRTERVLRETHGDLDSSLSVLGLAVSQLRDDVMKLRMVPISRLFSKYQRTVRELSHKLGKEVTVELNGAETELDKVLVERLEDPLLHLVRNAVDHGVEAPDERLRAGKPRSGRLVLGATQRGGQILVTIQDDGRGMDPDKLRKKAIEKAILSASEARDMTDSESFQLIFRAGFSTAAQVSDVSGRGVGMDVVRDAIAKLKGSIHLDSEAGRGTLLELRLPLTLAITQILAARVGGELVAIPLEAVASAQNIAGAQLEAVGGGTCLRVADELIPVVDLARVLGLGSTQTGHLGDGAEHSVVIIELGTERFGLLVQQVLGRHEVVIKSLGPLLAGTPCAAGATLVGDRILLVVDLAEVATRSRDSGHSFTSTASTLGSPAEGGVAPPQIRARVLVAEDSDTIREAIRRELTHAGFEVVVAADGTEALEVARRESFDAISTDVMMPGMDGYELTRRLRADPRYADVPIVMVTSKDARLDTLRGFDAGASAYITKPADAAELVRTLDGLLASKG